MDRFCFGVIAGLAISAIVGDSSDWFTLTLIVTVGLLYLIGRFFACKLSDN